MDDDNDIGVIGKGKSDQIKISIESLVILAVHMPLRNDLNRMQNTNQENDNTDTMSDEFDSDSKENDNVSFDLSIKIVVEEFFPPRWSL